MSSHPRFDLAHFSRVFALDELRREAHARARELAQRDRHDDEWVASVAANHGPQGGNITGPHDLAVVEQLRREVLGADAPPEGSTPTDAFAWALGEPPAPHLTKIGGLPYRPRERPWPTTRDGRACLFFGQISFVDSRDLFPDLPGDVLLVFGDPNNDFEGHRLEWVDVGVRDLVREIDVPPIWLTIRPNPFHPPAEREPERTIPYPTFVTCHGVIHRTYDLPDTDARFESVRRPRAVSCIEGTKIGGFPRDSRRAGLLATLGSVHPEAQRPYPIARSRSRARIVARSARSWSAMSVA